MTEAMTLPVVDEIGVRKLISANLNAETVMGYVPGPGFAKLDMTFDIVKLRDALEYVLKCTEFQGAVIRSIFLTAIPGDPSSVSGDNLRGRYWTRPDASYTEAERQSVIDETRYSEFVPQFANTYFREVYDTLSKSYRLGRVRLLKTTPRMSLSFHREPEPRLHIPIVTNPGAMMVINNHCTHMPADGSVYFTDTRAYHSAFNGGEEDRVHLIATLPVPQ